MKIKQTLNRRDFVRLTVAGGAILTGCLNSKSINSTNTADIAAVDSLVKVRYSTVAAETPSDPDYAIAKQNLDLYKSAVKIMKGLDNKDYRSWTNIAKIHFDHCSSSGAAKLKVHQTEIFLPWHRVYLYYFENICKNVLKENGKSGYEIFALPYWDWANSAVIPEIFHGKDIDSWNKDLDCVEPPEEWNVKVDWQRTNSWGFKPTNINLAELVKGTLKNDFFTLVGRDHSGSLSVNGGTLEITHNHIHNSYSGNINHTPTAALDPLFWLHHANVDWIWDQWLTKNGKSIPPPNWSKCVDYLNIQKCEDFGKIQLKQECNFCKLLNTDVRLEYIKDEEVSIPVTKKISEVIRISDLDYRYCKSEKIEFGDSLNLKLIDEKRYSITIFDGLREAKVGGVINVNVADIGLPNEQLNNFQKSINSIFDAKLKDISTSRLPSLLLEIEIEKPENPKIAFNIFINPDLDEPSADDKSYIFTISFFESADHNHSEGGKDNKRRYILDITDTILKFDSFSLDTARIIIRPIILDEFKKDVNGNIKLISLRFLIAQYMTSDAVDH